MHVATIDSLYKHEHFPRVSQDQLLQKDLINKLISYTPYHLFKQKTVLVLLDLYRLSETLH